MSIASEISRLQTAKADIKAAIEAKGVTVPSSAKLDDYDTYVGQISGGGPTPTPTSDADDVIFIDYDGTILHRYTFAEFLELTAMPSNPSHEGLVAQGWNWSLADAKAEATLGVPCVIGQLYTTSDGATRIYFTDDGSTDHVFTLYWSQTEANGVTIDWGDGSATETVSGTSNKSLSHTYAANGSYVISMKVTSGIMMLGRNGVFGGANVYTVPSNLVTKVELGSSVIIPSYIFYDYINLASISFASDTTFANNATQIFIGTRLKGIVIPSGITTFPSDAIKNQYYLKCVSIPKSVTSLGNTCFQNDYALEYVNIPSGVTTIGNYCFNYTAVRRMKGNALTSIGNQAFTRCGLLKSAILPSTLTTFGGAAFDNCKALESFVIPGGLTAVPNGMFGYDISLKELDLPSTVSTINTNAFMYCSAMTTLIVRATTPPTLASTNAFTRVPLKHIYVPAAAVETYKAASNWSSYSSIIEAIPA